jgi:endonuclease/exonuclease/phosphatase family metal-dependent hydrolase
VTQHDHAPTRRRAMRRAALALLAGVGLLGATLQPAAAATKPSQVGLVSFTRASYDADKGTTGLTIDWSDTSGAQSYEVFMSRSYSMSSAKKYKATASTKTVTGLARGKNYFFQVRAVNGSKVGARSQRVGHTTIRRQGAGTGPTYKVMTYNVCSDKCSGWSGRKPSVLGRVAAYDPDVITFQEAERDLLTGADLPGYVRVGQKSAKQLYLRADRFDIATGPDGAPRTGYVSMGHGKYAVWGEALDRTAAGKRVIFVSVHTTPGKTTEAADRRESEITKLVKAMSTINVERLPVVYGGDFNSHKNRDDDHVATVFHQAGFYDAYDLAQSLTRQHYNSYNDYKVKPVTSVKWGDHVDHVWSDPTRTRVLGWTNGVRLKGGRLVTPIGSDHSPVVVDVQVD